jgi:hypothetical protein
MEKDVQGMKQEAKDLRSRALYRCRPYIIESADCMMPTNGLLADSNIRRHTTRRTYKDVNGMGNIINYAVSYNPLFR